MEYTIQYYLNVKDVIQRKEITDKNLLERITRYLKLILQYHIQLH